MFEKVIIHRGLDKDQFDLGLLAETMLFYGDTLLLLDRGSLTSLIKKLDRDKLVTLVDEFQLKLSYHREAYATLTSTKSNIPSYLFAKFKAGTAKKANLTFKEEIEETITRTLGASRSSKRLIQAINDRVSPNRLAASDASNIAHSAIDDLRDSDYLRYAVSSVLAKLVPTYKLPNPWFYNILELGGLEFAVDTNLDFEAINASAGLIDGQSPGSITVAMMANYVFHTRSEAFYASSYMAGFVCDSLSSDLMKRRFLDLIRRRERDAVEIDLFQDRIITDGKKIREVINAGETDFTRIFPLLRKGRKFKDWLESRNPDEELLAEYFKEVSRESWIQTLPGKAFRWATCGGLGIAASAVFSPLLATAAAFGLGAVDSFLIERLLKGWRPDQFVNGPLSTFVGVKD
jgi:hypothetical protein